MTTLRPHLPCAVGGSVAVALMLVWSVDDGGFDPQTWYWGALVSLATLAVILVAAGRGRSSMPRPLVAALGLFALFVAWSYLSMTWAAYPGFALQGSNRALLYLLVFALLAVLPWTDRSAMVLLLVYAVGIGVIAVILLFRLATHSHLSSLFFQGRLTSPTGYFNSTAALFTVGALIATGLAARRGVTGPLRGLLLALACAGLQVAVTVQSRGWLFTLPLVGLVGIVVAGGRLRTAAHAVAPVVGTLVVLRPLLRVYRDAGGAALRPAAVHAGRDALLACAGVFVAVTLLAWLEQVRRRPPLPAARARALGVVIAIVALAGVATGLYVVSGHRPGPFVSKELHAFTADNERDSSSSHFVDLGSGRYDIWRVAVRAFEAHPIGGLGQDNFGDYYLVHRRTPHEPLWTHSLELRLLAHTGIVGTLLFAGFLVSAAIAAARSRRSGDLAHRMLVGVALLAIVDWLLHSTIDWFWEMPALAGPALGFLAVAAAMRTHTTVALDAPSVEPVEACGADRSTRRTRRLPRAATALLGTAALVAATVVLGLPFLAAREMSIGESASHTNVDASLRAFSRSHQLNPLMSEPGRLGGAVALVHGRWGAAEHRFRQAVASEPGDWFSWLGLGLARSSLDDRSAARRAFASAAHLDSRQPAVVDAVDRVDSAHPLTAAQALAEINYLP